MTNNVGRQSKLSKKDIKAIQRDTRLQALIAADYGISVSWVRKLKERARLELAAAEAAAAKEAKRLKAEAAQVEAEAVGFLVRVWRWLFG